MNSGSSMRSTKKIIKILSLILKIFGKENLYDGFDMLYVPNFMMSWVIVQIEYGYWRVRK